MNPRNSLPSSWASTPLGEVSEVIRGITFPASAKETEGAPQNVCCLRTTNIQREIDWSNVYFIPRAYVRRTDQLVKVGDILMSMANSYELVGKVAVARHVPFATAYGAFLAAVRPLPSIDGQYLFHLLRSPRLQRELRKGSSQTVNIANISAKTLAAIRVPLAPLQEQRRIGAKLDALLAKVDSCRERLDRVPLILKKFREAVLEAAVSGMLTEEWREGHPAAADARADVAAILDSHAKAGGHRMGNAAPPTSDVHDLDSSMFPREWGLVELRDVVEPGRPITYGILKPGPEVDDGVPYIRVADYPNNRPNLATIRKTSKTIDAEFARSRLRTGDLLVSIRGTVGRVIVIPERLDGANITQDSARLSVQQSLHTPYIAMFLRSPMAQTRMTRAIKGVAVRGINIGDVRAIQVAIPSLAEQREICRRVEILLSFADGLERKYAAALSQVERFTPSVLSRAFRGELLPQDPRDEPAGKMLERIRRQREDGKRAEKIQNVTQGGAVAGEECGRMAGKES